MKRADFQRDMTFVQLFVYILIAIVAERSWSLSVHDPRLSPGHLKPLGTGRPKFPVESNVDYPSPEGKTFYVSYISFFYFHFFMKYLYKIVYRARRICTPPTYELKSSHYFQTCL